MSKVTYTHASMHLCSGDGGTITVSLDAHHHDGNRTATILRVFWHRGTLDGCSADIPMEDVIEFAKARSDAPIKTEPAPTA